MTTTTPTTPPETPAAAPSAPATPVGAAAPTQGHKLVDLATAPRDFRSQEILCGMHVVYAGRKGSDLYLTEAIVRDVERGPVPSIIVQPTAGGRKVRLRNLHTVSIVPKKMLR